jgi:hypothetical protein
MTLPELLQANRGMSAETLHLPIAVTDWITKYVAGEKVPFGDMFHPDDYASVEMVVAILLDEGGVEPEMLPQSAFDYVEEWLYRLEESTDLHVWNDAQIARVFLTIVLQMAREVDSPDGHVESLQTILSRLCTGEELDRFYERHGLKPKAAKSPKPSQRLRDQRVAVKAARVLADPSVAEETKNVIRDAMNDLSTDAGVPTWHPALAERALTLMFESKTAVIGKADLKQSRQRLRDLVNAVPVFDQTRKPKTIK